MGDQGAQRSTFVLLRRCSPIPALVSAGQADRPAGSSNRPADAAAPGGRHSPAQSHVVRVEEPGEADQGFAQPSADGGVLVPARFGVNRADLQHPVGPVHPWIDAPYQPIAIQDRHDVVAVYPLHLGNIQFAGVLKPKQLFRSPSIARSGCQRARAASSAVRTRQQLVIE